MASTTIQAPPRTMMEVFKSLPEGTPVQLIENTLVMSPSPIVRHQRIHREIFGSLIIFLKQNPLGEVLGAPLDVYLDDKNVFQPDIIFINKDNMGIIQEDGFIYGAPDLVIELLSPSTAKYDFNQKKDVYERSGVKEYWIVDPENKEVMGYSLDEGSYGEPVTDQGVIRSRLLDHLIQF